MKILLTHADHYSHSIPAQFPSDKKEETVKKEEKTEEKEPVNTSIKLNFAGDCTLGNYAGQAYDGSFNQEYAKQGNDATYFFKNVKNVFENDDLTIVNLEGPLTSATSHVEKQFPFSGPKEYVNILTSGSVELVSIANNHSEDYYEQGMTDIVAPTIGEIEDQPAELSLDLLDQYLFLPLLYP